MATLKRTERLKKLSTYTKTFKGVPATCLVCGAPVRKGSEMHCYEHRIRRR